MSRTFFFGFRQFVKNEQHTNIQLGIYMCGMGVHAIYSYGTKMESIVEVHKTYIYTKNGFTDFMMIDKTGKHYNVNNSLWYGKWDSIEDWNNMNKGDILNIKYYGYRIPIFGFFPNIVYSKKNSAQISG